MYINHIAHYIPAVEVPNSYFAAINGVSDDWIVSRTGIHKRSKVSEGENTNTLAVSAALEGLKNLPYPVEDIDLIVGATYTPYDTVVTLAHAVQHAIGVPHIPVVSISSACSSFINAMEIVEGYFAMNKATKTLVITAEQNTAYANETDPKAGHLWGDAAAALFVSKERNSDHDILVTDIFTAGAATVGKGIEGVMLKPFDGGIIMPNGRDVFIHACEYMPLATKTVLERNGYTLDDLTYLVPHQANNRISQNVAKTLNLTPQQTISNIQYLGNTGCAGAAIGLSEYQDKFKKGDKIVVTVFGGGYSYGAMLLEK